MHRPIIGALIIILGISALFGVFLFKFAIALIIIAVGIRVITGPSRGHDYWSFGTTAVSDQDFINEVAVFSSLNKTIKSENFKGGKAVMVFAGGEINLSEVKVTGNEVKMELTAVFGGCKLIVPSNWRVNSQGVGIFGGYASKASGEGDVVLTIKGAAIFGGVEIIN
jgi:hypothetical protein